MKELATLLAALTEAGIPYTITNPDGTPIAPATCGTTALPFVSTSSTNGTPPITSLVYDSRAVTPGALYFAWPGVHVHGNTYIPAALEKGAAAVIYQDELPPEVTAKIAEYASRQESEQADKQTGRKTETGSQARKADQQVRTSRPVLIRVPDSRFAMAPVASAFYDNPSSKMVVIGVTGTEGKSSTVFFIWQLLRLLGKKTGFFSTVQCSYGGDAVDNAEHQTTPEAPVVQQKLAQMLENGCEYAVVESSSHGLSKKLNRLGSVQFDVGIMMNVTHEHLEFHGTHEQYKSDKANLFRALREVSHVKTIGGATRTVPSFGIVNAEDPAAPYFVDAVQGAVPVYAFTTNGLAGSGTSTTAGATLAGGSAPKAVPAMPGVPCVVATAIESAQNRVTFTAEPAGAAPKADNTPGVQNQPPLKAAPAPRAVSASTAPEAVPAATSATPAASAPLPFSTRAGFTIPMGGAFNVYNVLASLLCVAGLTGTDASILAPHVAQLTPVRGRMTTVNCGQPFEVIVDYAHTPSSFRTIFPPLKKRAAGRIISVFGSGGERDTQKRPEQGRIAAEFCDVVILADEDPRGEDPTALLEMIAAGAEPTLKRGEGLFIIPHRQTAIREAFRMAKPDDIVLLLGKSHENSIIYKDYVMPYDEIAEAEAALSEMGYTGK